MTEIGYLNTPLGVLEIRVFKTRIVGMSFTTHERGLAVIPAKAGIQKSKTKTKRRGVAMQRLYRRVESSFNKYFSGRLRSFNVPIRLIGTPFQKSVWRALRRIPYGHTCSYAGVAKWIGRPKAVRAVANAIAKNPIGIIIPCHRVILSDGRLGGFGWGITRKKRLLLLEKTANREDEKSNGSRP